MTGAANAPADTLAADRTLTGILLTRPDAARTAIDAALTPGEFTDARHGTIWTQICQFIEAGLAYTVDDIAGDLEVDNRLEECGGINHLTSLADMAGPGDAVDLIVTLRTAPRCSHCPRPAARKIAHEQFCHTCAEAFLQPIRDKIDDLDRQRTPFGGHGRQDGPLRPDYGDGWADLRCDRCGATWVGTIDTACDWCARSLELLIEAQRQVLRWPDLPEPDDGRRPDAQRTWAQRLVQAAAAGIITESEARSWWKTRTTSHV